MVLVHCIASIAVAMARGAATHVASANASLNAQPTAAETT